jgi:hypothetical protein
VFLALSTAARGDAAGAWGGIEVGLQERLAIEKGVEESWNLDAQARDGLSGMGNVGLCHVRPDKTKNLLMST